MSAVLSRQVALGLRQKPTCSRPVGYIDSDFGGEEPFIAGPPTSAGFSALLAEFRSVGGAARGDDLARVLEEHQRGDFVSLARLIATGRIFGYEWRRTLWIPMFQFDPLDLSVVPAATQVMAELSTVFDGWELASWFVERNDRLDGRRPVDLLGVDLPGVLAAARAHRFVAGG